MTRYLGAYFAILVVLVLVDLVWLGVIARPFYQQGIGHLMAEKANLGFAAVFYLFYPLGLVYFGIAPHADEPGWKAAAVAGALLGLFAYGTYDLTNLAVLKNWPIRLALVDMTWGVFISGATTAAGKLAFDRLSAG